jgi:hypothetical protein
MEGGVLERELRPGVGAPLVLLRIHLDLPRSRAERYTPSEECRAVPRRAQRGYELG